MHMIVLKGGDIRELENKYGDQPLSFLSDKCKSILSVSYLASSIPHSSCEHILTVLNNFLQSVHVSHLLNDADSFGCTPLHYACQEGNLASLDTLMKLGVSAKPKSAGSQSPLHFATMYGRYNACKRLINSPQVSLCVRLTESFVLLSLGFVISGTEYYQ